ncbi:hypothetical protein LBMAG42_48800 [Deltaproteobacteria bacterium]|nr:hypothetical protein LBMAG42_48800 [Deltaproteobacteria bacterium]
MAAVLTELARELRRFAAVATGADGAPPFAVVGGLAVSARTEPRFTRDVDVAVAVANDAAAEALVLHLQGGGYRVLAVLEHQNGRLSRVRMVPPGGSEDGVLVDLLFASSGVESEIVGSAQMLEVLPGVVLPVALAGDLLALKLLSVAPSRPKDAQDLVSLLGECGEADLDHCRGTLALITARGYNRGRSLHEALEALVRTGSGKV